MCTVDSVACKAAFQGSSFCLFTDQAGMTSITVSQIRSNFKKVAEHIKKANKRLTIEELFAICASAGPSQTLPRQGLLFEAFIEVCGSRVKHAKFKQACLTAGAGQPIALHSELKLLKHFRLRFYGWLLSALANLGNAGKVQMWYVTSIVKFLGLSRLGQSIMQQIGYAATDRYSDGRQRIALGVYDQLLRDVKDKPHIYNFDNYSNIIASYIPTSAKGAYANCAWTGHTLRKIDPKYDLVHRHTRGGMVPAMPATLFSNYLYQKLSDEMVITDNEGSRYLTKSMVYNAQVRSFPPKPKISEALRQSDPELVELLEAGSQDSLDEVYPSDVSVENCGSNLGLAGILKGIYTDYGVENGDNDYYIPILVDVNLYHRMLKGLYTTGGCGTKYLKVTAPLLGLWHTFKMAHILVYRTYAMTFLAPLFHHIVPGHEFYPQPGRLIQMQETFTNLRLAFDDGVQDLLRAAMADPRITWRYKELLQNLKDLLQFFIPTIQDYGVSIKLKDGLVVFNNLKRMLKVFLCLQPGQEYVRSLVHQLLTLIYWRKKRLTLPFWKMFTEDVGKFNEEPIELSFSLLGRSLVNDGMRSDIDHVRDKYKGVKNYVMFKKEFQTEFLDRDTMKSVSGRFHIKEGNAKLSQVKAWLTDTINKARYNSYMVYTDNKAYKSTAKARDFSANLDDINASVPRLYLQRSVVVLEGLKEKHRTSIENDWGQKAWGEVWDEYKVVAVADDEEEEEIEDGVANHALVVKAIMPIPKAGAGKRQRYEEEEESQGEEQSAEEVTKQKKMKRVPSVMNFKNKLAESDASEKEEFDRLSAEWLIKHPGKRLQGTAYFQLGELAKVNAANAAGASKRRRGGAQKGFYNERVGDETDIQAALQASLEMLESDDEGH